LKEKLLPRRESKLISGDIKGEENSRKSFLFSPFSFAVHPKKRMKRKKFPIEFKCKVTDTNVERKRDTCVGVYGNDFFLCQKADVMKSNARCEFVAINELKS
jgi:hypothetical protein